MSNRIDDIGMSGNVLSVVQDVECLRLELYRVAFRPRANNFMIEGIDNNDKSVTGPMVYLPNDAVGEFTLITNQFSPEFGLSAGVKMKGGPHGPPLSRISWVNGVSWYSLAEEA